MADPTTPALETLLAQHVAKRSDINQHLAVLATLSEATEEVHEMGVRGGVSSVAMVAGQARRGGGRVVGYDLAAEPAGYAQLRRLAPSVALEFRRGTVLTPDLLAAAPPNTLLFIDTLHIYGQLKRELAFHAGGAALIALHDTTVDAEKGELLRLQKCYGIKGPDDWDSWVERTGMPLEELQRGLWPAVEEFLATHSEWRLLRRYTHNNGLTVLARRDWPGTPKLDAVLPS